LMPRLRKQKPARSELQVAGRGFEIEAGRFGMRL